MKKQLLSRKRLTTLFYSLCLMLLCVNVSWGQTLPYDYTKFFASGAINSSGTTLETGNAAAVGTWVVGTTAGSTNPTIETSTLNYTSSSPYVDNNSGKQIVLPSSAAAQRNSVFYITSSTSTYATGTYYVSALINVTAAPASGSYFLSFERLNTGTTNRGRVYIKQTSATGFALATGVSTATGATYTSELSYGTTHLIVMKYTLTATPTQDVALFVDPAVGTTEGTATVNAVQATATGEYIRAFDVIQQIGLGATVAGLRFGTSWADVVKAASVTPTITSTKSTLSGFVYNQGSGPSIGQSFTVAGANLTNNLVVTPSTNYEISDDDGTTYDSSARTYVPSSGTVTDKVIFTRLKAGLSANAYNETITVASSGANVLSGGGVACTGGVRSLYYFNGTGSLASESSWGTNTDGSGSSPANFTNDLQAFYIINTTSVTTAAPWTVSGTNSKIILGDPSVDAVTLTVASGSGITGTIDIPAALSGSNSLILQDAVQPTFGTLNVASEVHYNAAIVTPIFTTSTVFGKVIIDAPTGQVSWVGNPVIQANGSMTVASGSTLFISGSSAYWTTISPGASVVINGTVRIQKVAGFVNSNVIPGTSYGSFQFTGSENLTLGANSIIEYNKGSNVTTYNITARSYPNLTISGLDNNKAFLGATTVTGKLIINTTGTSVITALTNLTPLTISPTGSLTLTSGTLNTGGFLTLKSSECCTATVAEVTGGSVSGNVIVERNIPAGFRAYRLLSPATTGGTINANWQEGGLVTTVGGISNPNPTFGTHITGAGGSGNGFDTTTSNAASIFTYDNTTPAWTALATTSGILTAGSPYLVYIRGSRLATNIDASLGNDATTLRTTGALTTGTVAVSVLNALANGFSIVGNPYQAQVDMNKVLVTNATAVNLAPFYYVVDPKLGGKGAYATVDLVTPGNSTAVDANQYLQPGQACFVQTVAAGSASLNFEEADKFEGTQTSVFKNKNVATARLLLTLNDASAKALDRLVISFDASESNTVNQNDASKLTNFDESMASLNNGKLLSIEKRAMPTETDEVPLNITKYRGTSYSIKAEGTGLTEPTPYLLDQFANKTIEIPQDGSVDYAYTVDTAVPASIAADRFKLIYAKTLKTIDNELAGFALYPNPSKSNSFSVAIPQSSSKASLTVSNMLGQQLYSQNDLQSGTTVKVTASDVKTSGVYLVSLTAEGKTTTTKWIVE